MFSPHGRVLDVVNGGVSIPVAIGVRVVFPTCVCRFHHIANSWKIEARRLLSDVPLTIHYLYRGGWRGGTTPNLWSTDVADCSTRLGRNHIEMRRKTRTM